VELYLYSPIVSMAWCLVKHRDNYLTLRKGGADSKVGTGAVSRIPLRLEGVADECMYRGFVCTAKYDIDRTSLDPFMSLSWRNNAAAEMTFRFRVRGSDR